MRNIKSLLVLALASLMAVSCFKDPQRTPAEKIAFDPAVFAKELNTEFTEFSRKYVNNIQYLDDYSGMAVLAGTYEIGGVDQEMNIFAIRDNQGEVDKIIMQPVNNDNTAFYWDYFTSNAAALGFGEFINAKYSTRDANGYCKSIAEARALVESVGASNVIVVPVFDYVPGKVRLLTMLEGLYFGLILQDSWLTADYEILYRWIGLQFDNLCTNYYTVCRVDEEKKTLSVDWSRDLLGNDFSILASSNAGIVNSVVLTLDESSLEGWDAVLSVFKKYAEGEKKLELGSYSKSYYQLGEEKTTFDSASAAVAWLTANGRPSEGELVVEYVVEYIKISIGMGADAMTVSIEMRS